MTDELVFVAQSHLRQCQRELHATREQVRRAYPGWDAAMAAKSRMDPLPVFRNALFDTYA